MGAFDYEAYYKEKLKDAARGFDKIPVKKSAIRLAEILKPRGPNGIREVLDLGAGDGRHTLYFAEKGFNVTAVDKSEAAIGILEELARNHPNITPVRADMTQVELLPEKQFDAAICTYVLHDMSPPQATAVSGYVIDHVVKGGYLVAAVFLGRYKRAIQEHVLPLFKGWATVTEDKGKTQTLTLGIQDYFEMLLQKK